MDDGGKASPLQRTGWPPRCRRVEHPMTREALLRDNPGLVM
jgi:hypothetical protein